MHLHDLITTVEGVEGVNLSGEVELESGSLASRQTFFPLAVDDYFMAVAILSKRLSKVFTWPGEFPPLYVTLSNASLQEKGSVGACIVSSDSLCVLSIGYATGIYYTNLRFVIISCIVV